MEEKEFEDKAIPLISEGFDLEMDGIEFLQKLSDKKIAIISIIGPVSSGKSFLATQICDKIKSGFDINLQNNTDCKTKGVWVWGKPIIKENYYIIILDAQGLSTDNEQNLEFSQKIFSLCTLISSIIIYNYKNNDNGKLTDDTIEQSFELFNKMLPFLQKIKLEDNEELSDDVNKISNLNIPDFIWIFRDSTTTDFNSFNELEKKFSEKNEYFKSLFKNKIKKYSLPCPMDTDKMKSGQYLQISDDDINKGKSPFSEEYKTSFNILKNKLINLCPPKIIKDLPLNGNLFYGLLQEYASSIFSGDSIFIESPLSNVVSSNLGEITDSINETFNEKLEEKNGDESDIVQTLKNCFEVFSDGLLNEYQNNYIGKLLHSNFMTEEIKNVLVNVSDEILDSKIGEKLSQFNDSIKELIEKENAEKVGKIESIADIKKSLTGLSNKIKSQVEENIFKKENEFLSSFGFIKDYINQCICEKINDYANCIQIYIENNLQTVESSSKINQESYENKIKELNNTISKLNIEMESMKLNSKEKEKKFEINLSIEKQKYIDLENQYKKIISDKNSEIKNLELKNNKINDELKNLYTEKNDKNELSKLKEENNKLKANLVVKENQIKDLTKLSKMQELEEKKKSNSAKENNDLNKIKESDIPEIKKIFKAINEKILNYSNELNKLEQNKDMFFHDKFIEISKSNWKNTYNIWNEELNQFKEKHFSTMIKNYSEELSKIKEEKNNLIKKLYNLTNEINKKKIEIDKLSEQFSSEKEIYQIKLEEIKNMKVANDALQKELDLYRAKLTDVENNLGVCKSEANITGQQVEYIMDAINSLIKKDKKKYLLYINKLEKNYRTIVNELNKTFNIIK